MERKSWAIGLAFAAAGALAACAAPVVGDPEEIRALYRAGKFAEAERAARALHRDRLRRFGEGSVEVAGALEWLTRTCRAAGDEQNPECLERAERALAAWEGAVGRDDPRLILPLRSLATIHLKATFRREAVRPLIERILAIQIRNAPPPSGEVAQAIAFLGVNLLHQEGDVDGARRELERARVMLAKASEIEPAQMGRLILTLAEVETAAARYEAALRLADEGLARLGVPEVTADVVGAAQDRRGEILERLGEFDAAEKAYAAAEEIRRRELGAEHTTLALSWKARARLAFELGDRAGAKRLYARAIGRLASGQDPQIRRAGYLDRVAELVDAELGLVEIALAEGDLDGAEGALSRAFDRVAKARVRNPLLLARLHERRAELERSTGRARQGLDDVERALGYYAGRLAPTHPLVARLELARGRLFLAAGEIAQAAAPLELAVARLRESLGAHHPALAEALVALSEQRERAGDAAAAFSAAREAARIETALRLDVVRFLPERLALLHGRERLAALERLLRLAADRPEAAAVELAWTELARVRSAALDAAAERRRGASGDEARALAEARRRVAHLHLAPLSDQPYAARTALLAEAIAAKEAIERRLAGSGAPGVLAGGDLELAAPLDLAPAGSALVAFALLDDEASEAAELVAFVRIAGAPAGLLRLGSAREAKTEIASWRAALRQASVAGAVGERARIAARRAGEKVRARIWDPVAAKASGADPWIVVPDGPLHFVPFEALPEGESAFVVERAPRIFYLGAERDLAPRPPRPAKSSAIELLAVGAPDPLPDGARFAPLAGAAAELEEVARIWRAAGGRSIVRGGAAATELGLAAAAPGSTIVHFATHAFFAALGERGVELNAAPDRTPSPEQSALAQAGLLLARHEGAAEPGFADGLLSGEEIAALDLGAAKLVVLSSCDSGAGTPERAEGVLGLRRGFALAGAGAEIVALFPVEDEAARALMAEIHGALAAGASPAAAVRQGALRRLAAARAAGRADDVRAWGAFIAIGRDADRPLVYGTSADQKRNVADSKPSAKTSGVGSATVPPSTAPISQPSPAG